MEDDPQWVCSIPAAIVQFYSRMDVAFRRDLKPVPGVVEALDKISLPMCVASSGPHHMMQTTLGVTGLLERFEGRIFSALDVGRGKPFPDLFLHAAERMRANPERPASMVRPARVASVRSILPRRRATESMA